MIKKKTKKSHSSDASYESNFSDGELRAHGLTKVPGSVVQDTESLWDYRLPVALRLRKKINSVGNWIRKSAVELKERLDVQDVSNGKIDSKSTSVETRKVDKSQQTCLSNLTGMMSPKRRRCRRPANVTAEPPPLRQRDCQVPCVPDALPASRIVYAVNVLLNRVFKTFADFRRYGGEKRSSQCYAMRVRVLDKTICLVRMLSRLLEDLYHANRDGNYVCRYDGLVDDYDACRKTYLEIKKYVRIERHPPPPPPPSRLPLGRITLE